VKQILRRGGVPLELQARKTSDEFLRELKDPETQFASLPLVYRDSEGSPREFDWFVGFKRQITTTYVRFELNFRIIIECKQRDDVEWFAFEVPREPWIHYSDLIPPLLSNAAFSLELRNALLQNNQLQLPDHRVTALDFRGKGDPALFGDPMVMEVAAASYDYLEFAAAGRQEYFPYLKPAVMQKLGIVHRFLQANRVKRPRRAEVVNFLQNLTTEEHQQYLAGIGKDSPQDVRLMAVIPLLCVNGPLHKVEISSDVEIAGFSSSENFIASRVHLEQWPGNLTEQAIMLGAGYPVVLTRISKLAATLQYLYGMFRATVYATEQFALQGLADTLPLQLAALDELHAYFGALNQDPI
jgi:hypothetical protein